MATSYGVTEWGFVRKPLSQIIEDVRGSLRGTFGDDVDLSDEGPFGQLVADLAAPVDEIWQVAEDVYDSMDPDAATGPRLVALCGITGTVPVTPTRSTVTLVAIGAVGTVIPALSRARVPNGGPAFRTTAPGTIAALNAWAQHNAAAGELRTNGGNVYRCTVNGATAASGGPTGTGLDIVDGLAHWRFLGAGTAAVEIPAESVDLGAIAAIAGSLSIIDTPIGGWALVTNALDAALGIAVETDPELRLRRVAEIEAQGEGSVDSIRGELLKVTGVSDARVFENVGDVVDANGLPPHSVEALVVGGADADVATVVFKKGAGIQTYGSATQTVNDAGGRPHTVNFSRPTSQLVYVVVHVTKETDSSLPQYPADGDAQVAEAIVNFANGLTPDLFRGYRVSDPVITSKLYRPIESIAGVRDVTAIYLGTAPGPTSSANLILGLRDLAVFDTSRISVLSS